MTEADDLRAALECAIGFIPHRGMERDKVIDADESEAHAATLRAYLATYAEERNTRATPMPEAVAKVVEEMRDRNSPVRVRYPERIDEWADTIEAAYTPPHAKEGP